MQTKPAPPQRGRARVARFLRWLPIYLLIAGTLYMAIIFLLAGPMYWTIYEAYQFSDGNLFVRAYFAPLVIACERSEAFNSLVDWYVGLWVYEGEWA